MLTGMKVRTRKKKKRYTGKNTKMECMTVINIAESCQRKLQGPEESGGDKGRMKTFTQRGHQPVILYILVDLSSYPQPLYSVILYYNW